MHPETTAVTVGGGPASPQRRWAASISAVLGPLIEIPAALLVLVEMIVLLAGVISRYVFHSPIIWSDELASILFLWLAMLGSVVALRRGEHTAEVHHPVTIAILRRRGSIFTPRSMCRPR